MIGKVVVGICTKIDGCPIVNNSCVDCLTCEELVGVTWRVSDCEELVGVTHRG